jgi:uncharacterized coiled-coil DUF342 family protein
MSTDLQKEVERLRVELAASKWRERMWKKAAMSWMADADALKVELEQVKRMRDDWRKDVMAYQAEIKGYLDTANVCSKERDEFRLELKQERERNARLVEALKQIAYDAGSWDQLRDKYQWQYCNIAKQALQSAAKE